MLKHVFVGMRVKTPEGAGVVEKFNRYKSPQGWTSAWVKVRLANGLLRKYKTNYENFEFSQLELIHEFSQPEPEPEYKTPRERLEELFYTLSDAEVDALLLLLEK